MNPSGPRGSERWGVGRDPALKLSAAPLPAGGEEGPSADTKEASRGRGVPVKERFPDLRWTGSGRKARKRSWRPSAPPPFRQLGHRERRQHRDLHP